MFVIYKLLVLNKNMSHCKAEVFCKLFLLLINQQYAKFKQLWRSKEMFSTFGHQFNNFGIN